MTITDLTYTDTGTFTCTYNGTTDISSIDSPPLPPPPSRSRSSLPPRESTPYGSEAPSWLPCPPSSRCGSPSRSTTSAAHPLSTASASKRLLLTRNQLLLIENIQIQYQFYH